MPKATFMLTLPTRCAPKQLGTTAPCATIAGWQRETGYSVAPALEQKASKSGEEDGEFATIL